MKRENAKDVEVDGIAVRATDRNIRDRLRELGRSEPPSQILGSRASMILNPALTNEELQDLVGGSEVRALACCILLMRKHLVVHLPAVREAEKLIGLRRAHRLLQNWYDENMGPYAARVGLDAIAEDLNELEWALEPYPLAKRVLEGAVGRKPHVLARDLSICLELGGISQENIGQLICDGGSVEDRADRVGKRLARSRPSKREDVEGAEPATKPAS